ncbi:MAG: hypothetical protein FK730_06245 [Asgard group archaeon]|nr:hypothetical protein [Asgard group archaeon]
MSEVVSNLNIERQAPKRYVSLDFARGIAIFLMLALHNVMTVLDINELLKPEVINTLPIINLLALVIIPFFGGLAGFFLLVSAIGNMISIYRDLEKGRSVGSLVVKQIVSGFLLLFFAMIIENFTGYFGLAGQFFKNLNNVGATNWEVIRYRFNHFETIHTIAWCIILNGIVHGILSINNNWQNRKRMIIIYAILAVIVVGVTQPIWSGVGNLVEGYPFGIYPNGHSIYMPWAWSESWRDVFRAPFLGILAGREEPVFPYLAVSFMGSIIGIVLSKPKEEISKKFTKSSFAASLIMFLGGLLGIIIVIIKIADKTDIDTAILFYKDIALHRNWALDRADYIPPFSFLG